MGLTLTLHENLTDKQRQVLRSRSDFQILDGPAGTSKTYTAIARGLKALSRNEVEKVVIIRSAVEIRKMGFLPGGQNEKMDAYAGPYIPVINQLSPKKNFRSLIASKELDFQPTSYLRGMTFDDTFVIVDEFQNLSAHELDTIVTRIGEGTQLVICGDSSGQSDLPSYEATDYRKVFDVLVQMPDFDVFLFTEEDIVRSDFVRRYYLAKRGVFEAPQDEIDIASG